MELWSPPSLPYTQHCQKNTDTDPRAGQGVLQVQKCPGTRAYCALMGSSVPPSRGPRQEHPLSTQASPAPGGECPPAPTNICVTGGLSPEEENLGSGHTHLTYSISPPGSPAPETRTTLSQTLHLPLEWGSCSLSGRAGDECHRMSLLPARALEGIRTSVELTPHGFPTPGKGQLAPFRSCHFRG